MRGFPADLASTSASDAILERNDDIPIVSRSIQSAEENTLSRNLSEEVDDLSDEVDGLQDGQGDSLDLEDEDDDSPDLRSRKHHKGKAKHKSHKSGKSHKKAAVHTSLKKGLLTGKGTFVSKDIDWSCHSTLLIPSNTLVTSSVQTRNGSLWMEV